MDIPTHVAIIMDGNGRWAKKRGLPRTYGHKQGVKTLKKIVNAAAEINVSCLTVYAFSTENWKRPQSEIDFLFKLFASTLEDEGYELAENDVKINIIGRKKNLPQFLIDKIDNIEKQTVSNKSMQLNIAFNYGGRAEIVDTTKRLLAKYNPEEITEELFTKNIYLNSYPEVELLIRTGGEKRLSNFLLWECAYSEIFFTEKFWPEFDSNDFKDAINDYMNRDRRFGGINDNAR